MNPCPRGPGFHPPTRFPARLPTYGLSSGEGIRAGRHALKEGTAQRRGGGKTEGAGQQKREGATPANVVDRLVKTSAAACAAYPTNGGGGEICADALPRRPSAVLSSPGECKYLR